jgi:hypothetical protein
LFEDLILEYEGVREAKGILLFEYDFQGLGVILILEIPDGRRGEELGWT